MEPEVDQFVQSLKGTLAPRSVDGCRLDLMLFLDFLADRDVKSWRAVKAEQITGWVDECSRYSEATKRTRLHWTRKLLEWLGREKYARQGLAKNIPSLPSLRPTREHLPFGKRDKILRVPPESAEDARALALMWVIVSTGCKTSEAREMSTADVAADGRAITVRAGSETACQVEVDAQCAAHVLRWLEQRAEIQGRRRAKETDALFIGTGATGRVSLATMQNDVRRIADRAGVANVTPKSLRHTAYLQFRAGGRTLQEIGAIMGLTEYSVREFERSLRGQGLS